MKPTQLLDGLIERWTLAPNELLLLMNKSGPGRLGFATLLKFFQAEGLCCKYKHGRRAPRTLAYRLRR